MKGFKNLIILLGCCLAFALATPKASAISFENIPTFTNKTPGNYNGNLRYRSDKNYITRYTDGTTSSVSISYKSSASPIFMHLGTSPYFKQTFNLTYSKSSNYFDFVSLDYNYNSYHNYLNISGVSEVIDGQTVLFDNIWFLNNSFVLYNDDLTHTLQYLGNYKIIDYIFFIDPLTSTLEDGSLDNFYLISIPKKKARSLKLVDTWLDSIYYGSVSNSIVQQFPYVNSYTLLETTNTTAFPKFSNYMSSTSSYFSDDIGFLYNKDSTFIAPDFGGSTDSDSSHSNFNIDLVNQYNDCVNKGENLRKALQLSAMCKLQGEDSWENIIINTGLNYTGSNSYCSDLDTFISTVYSIYSGNWNTGIINENINLQDNSAPFNDLIFSWYYNSVFIDSGGNISGLPNGNSWCTAYTVSNFYDSEKSTIEKISESIADFFGHDIADIYNNTVGSHSTFSGLITSLSAGTSGFFNGYLFEPYITQFNSGYNKFYSAVNLSGCSVIKQTFPDTVYGDLVFFVAIVAFIFIFIRLL